MAATFSPAGVQALLEVVNDLFEEQTDLEKIVRKIMHRAQKLLKCEHCSVQLLEDIDSPVGFESLTCACQSAGSIFKNKQTNKETNKNIQQTGKISNKVKRNRVIFNRRLL